MVGRCRKVAGLPRHLEARASCGCSPGGRGGAGHVLDASGAFREARDAGHADAAGGEA